MEDLLNQRPACWQGLGCGVITDVPKTASSLRAKGVSQGPSVGFSHRGHYSKGTCRVTLNWQAQCSLVDASIDALNVNSASPCRADHPRLCADAH